MNPAADSAYLAFEGDRRVAAGNLRDVARAVKELLVRRNDASILIFDGTTSEPVELDLRGAVDDVVARLPADDAAAEAEAPPNRGPGRPKLGIEAADG